MDAFWGITLSIAVIMRRVKKIREEVQRRKRLFPQEVELTPEEIAAEKARKEIEYQKDRTVADLKRQGYTDELIAIIIPQLYNGK